MHHKIRLAKAALLVMLLSACGESEQQAENRKAHNLKILGEATVKNALKDPESAVFRNQFIGKKGLPCGEVNAKNSFGGMTGYKRYAVASLDLAAVEGENMNLEEFATVWATVCR